ncbi:hypothetical protein DOTSEDRAFT_20477 [Dothistroma septosporum NZE10]|uniref:Uncharacterized protein n=1 Tax=Dothistroma septosporum (strain NZE10 / CBS 128990) TaxID=675120 RepID=N1Q2W4_DOTSN|nr:hypothetical protein DOTSEDRAFT_20477 [Dothistroma septosporum NZE10]
MAYVKDDSKAYTHISETLRCMEDALDELEFDQHPESRPPFPPASDRDIESDEERGEFEDQELYDLTLDEVEDPVMDDFIKSEEDGI